MEMDERSNSNIVSIILFLLALQYNNVWEAHLAIAGEGGVIKQKVGTKEEDNSIKHPQACPIQEDRPAEEGVLRYVPTENGRGIKKIQMIKHNER